MLLNFEDRPSDSPFVERIWGSRSEQAGPFSSIAMSHREMVVTRYNGNTIFTVRRPETQATPLHLSSVGGEWFGIRFKLGTLMPHPVNLPDTSGNFRCTLHSQPHNVAPEAMAPVLIDFFKD